MQSMSEFERKLSQLVLDFASQLADRASLHARRMVDAALEQGPRRTRRRKDSSKDLEKLAALFGLRARGRRPTLARAVQEFERHYIVRALSEHEGNVTRAAVSLGIARQVLQRKIQRLNRLGRRS